MFNRIDDGETGDSSYLVDFPQGGRAFLVGNVLHQGPNARNNGMVSFGAEKNPHADSVLFVVNNTFVTDRANTVFLKIRHSPSSVSVVNNIFAGGGEFGLGGDRGTPNNLLVTSPADSPFVAWKERDFSLCCGCQSHRRRPAGRRFRGCIAYANAGSPESAGHGAARDNRPDRYRCVRVSRRKLTIQPS